MRVLDFRSLKEIWQLTAESMAVSEDGERGIYIHIDTGAMITINLLLPTHN